jgi:4-hydroxybenzoate polyprenyltransferase
MNRLLLQLIDLIFLTRPVLLIPVWGFAAFGYWHGSSGTLGSLTTFWFSTSLSVYLSIFAFSLSVGSVYILNQIADIEVDKLNGGLPLLASGITSTTAAWTSALVLFLISLLHAFLSGNSTLALCSISTIILGFLYSFKPAGFSGRPFLDFISNALGYGIIAFGAGWSLSESDLVATTHFLNKALPYFLLMCAGSISSTLPDRAGDKALGKNTTAVILGNRNAHLLATLLLILALLLSITTHDTIALLCSTVPLALYIGYIFRSNKVLMEATYKVGGALCMICSCLILPLILPAGVVVFLVTRLYFRLRHRVIYPSLVPVR